MLAQIVSIRSVAYHREPARPRFRHQPAPQLGLAEKAAVRGIGEVVRVLELVGVELDQWDVEPLGQGTRGFPLGAGIGGAPADGREHPIRAELLAQHDRQEGGGHAPGVPQKTRLEGANELTQGGDRAGHGGIVPTYGVPIKGQFQSKKRIDRRSGTVYSYDPLTEQLDVLRIVGKRTRRTAK